MLPIRQPAFVPQNVRPIPRLHAVDAIDSVHGFLLSPGAKTFARYAVEFETWCAAQGLLSLPAMDETIAVYLKQLWDSPGPPSSVAVLRNHYTGIRSLHYMNGYECGETGLIQRVLRTIDRRSPPPNRAEPLMLPDAKVCIQLAMREKCRVRALRDRLLFTLRVTMARTVEFCNISVEDVFVSPSGDWLRIRVLDAKTNKGGSPEYLWAARSDDALVCPVRAYRAHLAASGIVSGPVFRGINGAKPSLVPMSTNTLRYTMHKYARLAGLIGKYTGYSLRRGGATGAALGTGSLDLSQERLRHRDRSTTHMYIAQDRLGPLGPNTDQIL